MRFLALVFVSVIVLFCSSCSRNRNHEELMRITALNEQGYRLDTISSIPRIVDYYDNWGSADVRMTTHYLLGRYYYDKNNLPRALRSYLEAVSFADTLSDDCNYQMLSRIYGQIADIYHHQRSPSLELDAERKAVDYAWQAGDTLSAIIFYEHLSDAFHMLNKMDSVIIIDQRAAQLYEEYGRKDFAVIALSSSMSVYLRQGKYLEAKRVMDDYERYSGLFDKFGNIEHGREIYYLYKGQYYEGVNRPDSAEFFYRKLLQFHIDYNEEAYKGLLSVYQRIGNKDSISKYAYLCCQSGDSASFRHSADEILRLEAIYNYEESERIAAQKEKEVKRFKISIFLILFLVLLIMFLIYVVVQRQKQKQKRELGNINKEYNALLEQYQKVREEWLLSKNDWETFKVEKEQEIFRLQKHLSQFIESPTQNELWSWESALLNSPIVSQFHKLASTVKKPSWSQWEELEQVVKNDLPQFVDMIRHHKVFLTEQEIMICLLVRLQFIPTEIAALLNVSKQRVTNLRSDINMKLFGEKGSKTLDANIMAISKR